MTGNCEAASIFVPPNQDFKLSNMVRSHSGWLVPVSIRSAAALGKFMALSQTSIGQLSFHHHELNPSSDRNQR